MHSLSTWCSSSLICLGGGIIGSTTAYFLSHHEKFDRERDSITLLEATKIAGGASGKAGGLLGLWAYPSCIVPLSYKLHKEVCCYSIPQVVLGDTWIEKDGGAFGFLFLGGTAQLVL